MKPPSTPWAVVKPGDAAAQHTGATRNAKAERGEGRAWRHEPNMTPVVKAQMQKRSNRTWGQSNAVEQKTDMIGRTMTHTVMAKSGNNDGRSIGINKSSVGIYGFGEAPAAAATSNTTLYLLGAAALAAAFLLFRK
jgi:hypothetical protein